jgi:hypothetical protein
MRASHARTLADTHLLQHLDAAAVDTQAAPPLPAAL